jgi:hypothetical protein
VVREYCEEEPNILIQTPFAHFSFAKREGNGLEIAFPKDRGAFPHMSMARSAPCTLWPPFGLEPWVELTRIMQESKNRETGESGRRKRFARCFLHPPVKNGQACNHLKAGSYIRAVMSEVVPLSFTAFCLCPRRTVVFHPSTPA